MRSQPPKTGRRAGRRPKSGKENPPPTGNPNLYAQTRKILLKHYRTKYGVRHRGGGR